jgi:hypothetical protein
MPVAGAVHRIEIRGFEQGKSFWKGQGTRK